MPSMPKTAQQLQTAMDKEIMRTTAKLEKLEKEIQKHKRYRARKDKQMLKIEELFKKEAQKKTFKDIK